MFETIQYSVDNGIARITLERPDSLNAFIARMNKDIQNAVKKAEASPDVRCIVITGAGRAFCSGQDLSEVNEEMDHGQVLRDHYGPMVKQIQQCEKPVIAAVNGVAAGAGFSLALACDFRIMSERASFMNAFIHVGLIPDSGNLYFLKRIVGEAKAIELSVLGERITAEQSLNMGLATKVIPAADWESAVDQFASHIANLPTKAIGLIKRLLTAADSLTFTEYLEREAQGQRIAGLTTDHREGISAFLDKRKPTFSGK
ncbi:2-(1,2-epoxy-1,2-dihydrophenyl)acetyl-CoA isomerase [Bacillus ectoiniformans]|uniref:enoyl-CoA hydratase-related protein n=1 Tax=Bacillus ectoiniformans TaxID=1494429 RepID=UPI00195A6B49|nr:enoyl-CoA hydratase-related protein [Bacillus ectoiniformans]MBM7649143.1 2-(1,2-epoxy-1,2-dihydrophenyl)acetyl-CoA isomerase [Bacillus ectoiniformans]